jgi:hypothetical protein
MRDAIRLGVILAAVLGSSAAWTTARADGEQYEPTETGNETEAVRQGDASQQESQTGAASMEPKQETEQDEAAERHAAWVAQPWNDLAPP